MSDNQLNTRELQYIAFIEAFRDLIVIMGTLFVRHNDKQYTAQILRSLERAKSGQEYLFIIEALIKKTSESLHKTLEDGILKMYYDGLSEYDQHKTEIMHHNLLMAIKDPNLCLNYVDVILGLKKIVGEDEAALENILNLLMSSYEKLGGRRVLSIDDEAKLINEIVRFLISCSKRKQVVHNIKYGKEEVTKTQKRACLKCDHRIRMEDFKKVNKVCVTEIQAEGNVLLYVGGICKECDLFKDEQEKRDALITNKVPRIMIPVTINSIF